MKKIELEFLELLEIPVGMSRILEISKCILEVANHASSGMTKEPR